MKNEKCTDVGDMGRWWDSSRYVSHSKEKKNTTFYRDSLGIEMGIEIGKKL